MNAKIPLPVAIIVVFGAVAAVYICWGQRESGMEKPLVLHGNVDIRESAVAFRKPGRMMNSVVEEGDTVRTGQVMAEIDPQFYSDALAGADADVQQARAELQSLRGGNLRPPDIKRTEQAVREAEAPYQTASDFHPQIALGTDGIASAGTLGSVRAARDEAATVLVSATQAWALQLEGSLAHRFGRAALMRATRRESAGPRQTELVRTAILANIRAIVAELVGEPA